MSGQRARCVGLATAWVFGILASAGAQDQKFIRIDEMTDRGRLEVNADGTRVYVGSSEFMVFDENASPLKRFGYPNWGNGALDLFPLANGWFIRAIRGLGGQVSLCRPDGSDAKLLAHKGNMGSEARSAGDAFLRHDMTGWSSPTAWTRVGRLKRAARATTA